MRRAVLTLGSVCVAHAIAESMGGHLGSWAGPDVETRNFGVVSYSPVLYLLQWRERVRQFHPTHVVVVLFNNDVDDDAQYYALSTRSADGDVVAVPAPGSVGMRGIIGRSHVLRLAAIAAKETGWLWQHRGEETGLRGNDLDPDISSLTSRCCSRSRAKSKAAARSSF